LAYFLLSYTKLQGKEYEAQSGKSQASSEVFCFSESFCQPILLQAPLHTTSHLLVSPRHPLVDRQGQDAKRKELDFGDIFNSGGVFAGTLIRGNVPRMLLLFSPSDAFF